MSVRIRIPSFLRRVTDASMVEIKVNDLFEAIEKLDELFPGIKRELTDPSGKLLTSAYDFYINGNSNHPTITSLKDGDEVIIIPLGIEVGG